MLFTSPAKAVPPDATVYHLYCPFVPPIALKVTLPGKQDSAPVVVGAVGNVLIVATTGVRALSHVPLLIATW